MMRQEPSGPRRQSMRQRPTRSRRQDAGFEPTRSYRTSVRRALPVTQTLDGGDQELRNSHFVHAPDEAQQVVGERATIPVFGRVELLGPPDLQEGARAERRLRQGRQAGAAEIGREQEIHGLAGAPWVGAEQRAELAQPKRQLGRVFLLGERVRAGREMAQHRLE